MSWGHKRILLNGGIPPDFHLKRSLWLLCAKQFIRSRGRIQEASAEVTAAMQTGDEGGLNQDHRGDSKEWLILNQY